MNEKNSINNFLPLISVVSIILIFSIAKQIMSGEWDLHDFMNSFMGAFFIVFGILKILNLRKFAEAYAMYDLIARRSNLYAYAYPFIEITLGSLYLLRWYPIAVNALTCIIMLISAAGVALALYQRKSIQCACLGMVFIIPMTYVTLAENLLMAGMAALMLWT